MTTLKFDAQFNDSWGNDISFYSGATDNVLHLMITEDRHPTAGYLSYEDATKMIEILEDYKVYVLENKNNMNGE